MSQMPSAFSSASPAEPGDSSESWAEGGRGTAQRDRGLALGQGDSPEGQGTAQRDRGTAQGDRGLALGQGTGSVTAPGVWFCVVLSGCTECFIFQDDKMIFCLLEQQPGPGNVPAHGPEENPGPFQPKPCWDAVVTNNGDHLRNGLPGAHWSLPDAELCPRWEVCSPE